MQTTTPTFTHPADFPRSNYPQSLDCGIESYEDGVTAIYVTEQFLQTKTMKLISLWDANNTDAIKRRPEAYETEDEMREARALYKKHAELAARKRLSFERLGEWISRFGHGRRV